MDQGEKSRTQPSQPLAPKVTELNHLDCSPYISPIMHTICLACLLTLLSLTGCKKIKMETYPANHPLLHWQGRIIENNAGQRAMSGSASSLKFRCYGNSCRIRMANIANEGDYNYISMIVDGKRYPRMAIKTDTLAPVEIPIPAKAEYHDVEIYKETEPKNGLVLISAIETEGMGEFPFSPKPKIEFIGDSYTAGMSADATLIPCDEGTWFDQHNAYDAFGPSVARALECDYLIAAFSGMGMYRNWNTDYPLIGDVYESTMLSPDTQSHRWNFKSFIPEIVAVAFGANDLSDGDFVSPRLPFDPIQFTEAYVTFLKKINAHYPDAKVVITNCPGLDTEKDQLLRDCLPGIKSKAESEIENIKPITVFKFALFTPAGCGGHPDLTQHREMANALEPVLKGLLK